jgi:predicted enzyme related to lactoylglutathione lyase
MTHRSRLTAVLVDVPPGDFDKTVAFWGAVLGGAEQRFDELPEYVAFGHPTPGIEFMVQSVGDPTPRIHIDIETDDIEAEVARLSQLGATEIGRHRSWVIMKDPASVVFCVVRVQDKEAFEAHAKTWE